MKRFRPLFGAVLVTLVFTALTPVVRSETGSNGVDLIERWSLDWRFRPRGALRAA